MSNKRNTRRSMVTPKNAGVRPIHSADSALDETVTEPASSPETAIIPVAVESFDAIEDTVIENDSGFVSILPSKDNTLLEKGDLVFDDKGKIVEVAEVNDDPDYVVETNNESNEHDSIDEVDESNDIGSIDELNDSLNEVIEPDMLFILRRLEFLILTRDDVQRDLDAILFSGKPKRRTPERIFMKSLQHEKKFLQKEMQFLVSNLVGSSLDRQVIKRAVLNAGKNEYSV